MIESAVRGEACITNVSLCDFTEKRAFVQVYRQCSHEATGIYRPQCSVHISRGCRCLQRHSVQILLDFAQLQKDQNRFAHAQKWKRKSELF